MNADRRATIRVSIDLVRECNKLGEVSDESDATLTATLKSLIAAEHWQLKAQEKHAGKNESTDKQIAIATVALEALQAAQRAYEKNRFRSMLTHLKTAMETDGTGVKK